MHDTTQSPTLPPRPPLTFGRALPWLLPALVVFLYGVHALWPLTIDDAFISARYARNFARGLGLVYNPGDAPTEGFSNLTLVLLTAGLVKAGMEAIVAAKAIAAVAGLLCLLLTGLVGRLILPRHYPLPVLLAATSFCLMVWSAAGLETSLMALLTLLWLYLALLLTLHKRAAVQWALATVSVLAALTRPEGLLFLPALALLNWRARRAVKISWWWLVGACLVLAGHELWRISYFGRMLPLPFYVKVEVGSALDKLSGGYYLHAFVWSYAGGVLGYLALAYAWLQRQREDGLPGYLCLLAAGPFMLFVLAVGADWMPQYRFLIPVLPVLALLTVQLLLALTEALQATTPRVAALLLPLGMALLLLGNAAAVWRGTRTNEWHSTKQERLDIHWGASDALRAQGLWLKAHGGPKLTLAALDIGAPGYYGEVHIIDMHGLTNPALAGKSGEEVAPYVLQRRPQYVQCYAHAIERLPEFKALYRRSQIPWNVFARRDQPAQ